jgi:hypothetical protein
MFDDHDKKHLYLIPKKGKYNDRYSEKYPEQVIPFGNLNVTLAIRLGCVVLETITVSIVVTRRP